jgi:hypothetical protein
LGELSDWVLEKYYKYENYWHIILLILVITGVFSKPLAALNGIVVKFMWNIIQIILI